MNLDRFRRLIFLFFILLTVPLWAKHPKTAPAPVLPSDPPETASWHLYRNTAAGLEFKYPTDLEYYDEGHPLAALLRENDYYWWTYLYPQLQSWLRVGLAPTVRDDFKPVIEIYISDETQKFINLGSDSFLGMPLLPREGKEAPLQINGHQSDVRDVRGDNDRIHNLFFIADNRVYLFVVHNPTPHDLEVLNLLLATVKVASPTQ